MTGGAGGEVGERVWPSCEYCSSFEAMTAEMNLQDTHLRTRAVRRTVSYIVQLGESEGYSELG